MSGAGGLPPALERVAEGFRAGREIGLSRAISVVEDERPGYEALLDALHEGVGRARRVGITGPPGAGKSTLTSALARRWLDAGLRVGILAADPTSPFTGGALLGDRIRMSELATEEGVFIRSMASRGSLGGLAGATREAADLMDAFGFDRILLETIGVGQSELEIAGSADTTVVVLVPESGDGVQAMKAGLMEVADLFVVNKSDRTGADRLVKELEVSKKLRSGEAERLGAGHHGFRPGAAEGAAGGDDGPPGEGGAVAEEDGAQEAAAPDWDAPVLKTVASRGEGVEALDGALDEHFAHLEATGLLVRRRREHLLEQVRAVLVRRAARRAEALWEDAAGTAAAALEEDEVTPYEVADRIEDEARPGA